MLHSLGDADGTGAAEGSQVKCGARKRLWEPRSAHVTPLSDSTRVASGLAQRACTPALALGSFLDGGKGQERKESEAFDAECGHECAVTFAPLHVERDLTTPSTCTMSTSARSSPSGRSSSTLCTPREEDEEELWGIFGELLHIDDDKCITPPPIISPANIACPTAPVRPCMHGSKRRKGASGGVLADDVSMASPIASYR